MKVKSLLALTLIAASANAFSITITHGKLISHKEWATSNDIKGKVTPIAIDLKKFNPNLMRNKNSGDVTIINQTAVDKIPSLSVNQPVNLGSSNASYIFNDSGDSEYYNVTSSLCTEIMPQHADLHCYSSEDFIEVDAGGIAQIYSGISFETVYKTPGDYNIFTKTMVMPAQDSGKAVYYYSADAFNLTVADNHKK